MTFVKLPLQESSDVAVAREEEDAAVNSGSVVGLPMDYSKSNSMAGSFSDTEDESLDELTAAADLLTRSLLVEQQQKLQLAEEEANKKKNIDMTTTADDESTPVRKTSATTNNDDGNNKEGEEDNGDNDDRRPSLVEVVETNPRITPSPSPPPLCEEPDHSSSNRSLEERVQELETKLAALSRLLQGQQRLSIRSLVRIIKRRRNNSTFYVYFGASNNCSFV